MNIMEDIFGSLPIITNILDWENIPIDKIAIYKFNNTQSITYYKNLTETAQYGCLVFVNVSCKNGHTLIGIPDATDSNNHGLFICHSYNSTLKQWNDNWHKISTLHEINTLLASGNFPIIQADTIQADTIQADTIQADTIQADTIQADTIQADTIQADTGVIQTLTSSRIKSRTLSLINKKKLYYITLRFNLYSFNNDEIMSYFVLTFPAWIKDTALLASIAPISSVKVYGEASTTISLYNTQPGIVGAIFQLYSNYLDLNNVNVPCSGYCYVVDKGDLRGYETRLRPICGARWYSPDSSTWYIVINYPPRDKEDGLQSKVFLPGDLNYVEISAPIDVFI